MQSKSVQTEGVLILPGSKKTAKSRGVSTIARGSIGNQELSVQITEEDAE